MICVPTSHTPKVLCPGDAGKNGVSHAGDGRQYQVRVAVMNR